MSCGTWIGISCKPIITTHFWTTPTRFCQLFKLWRIHEQGWVLHGPTPSTCKDIKSNDNKIIYIQLHARKKRKFKNILVEFCHGSEKLNKPMKGVKDNVINKDVLGGLIIMQMVNILTKVDTRKFNILSFKKN
jgi:hypothetical protein